jgi:hypothetical protein
VLLNIQRVELGVKYSVYRELEGNFLAGADDGLCHSGGLVRDLNNTVSRFSMIYTRALRSNFDNRRCRDASEMEIANRSIVGVFSDCREKRLICLVTK